MKCRNCGTPAARPDQPFCGHCGEALGGVGPRDASGDTTGIAPPPQSYGVPMPPARQGGVGRVVAVAVLSLLAAIGGGGLAYAVLHSEGGAGNVTDARTGSAEVGTDRADEGNDVAAGPGTPSATPSAARFRCWNDPEANSPVRSLTACPLPEGVEGMHWVFGRTKTRCLDATGARIVEPVRSVPSQTRIQDADCWINVGGVPVRVHYSQWLRWPVMSDNYAEDSEALLSMDDRADLVVSKVESPRATYKVALHYKSRQAPWSVTVYADTEDRYQRVLQLIDIRRIEYLRGVAIGGTR